MDVVYQSNTLVVRSDGEKVVVIFKKSGLDVWIGEEDLGHGPHISIFPNSPGVTVRGLPLGHGRRVVAIHGTRIYRPKTRK